ncbi:hypothetical protein R2A130_2186 [Ahrensia sp. R2A130]|nr:hypothetical protein R2A130_2186 [Ahrensia sp. R2A130]
MNDLVHRVYLSVRYRSLPHVMMTGDLKSSGTLVANLSRQSGLVNE